MVRAEAASEARRTSHSVALAPCVFYRREYACSLCMKGKTHVEVSLSLSLTLITLVRALSARARRFFYELYRVRDSRERAERAHYS